MPTGSTRPLTLCLRSLMKVSVIAVTSAIGPFSHIAVSMQCASRSPVTPLPATATSRRHKPSPPCGSSLRDRPVLQKLRAIVKHAAEPPLVHERLDQRDGRHAAVVVPDHVRHAGRLDGVDHALRFVAVASERLLAQHHLACARGGDRNLGMRVVRAGDVDEVDVGPLDERCASRFRPTRSPSSPRTSSRDRRFARTSPSAPADTAG